LFLVGGLLGYANCGKKEGDGGSGFTPQKPFVSVWQTTTANETITLPLREGFEYNMKVDWGDGSPVDTITDWNASNRIHEYAEAGTYTITIRGKAEAWYFNACGMTPDAGSEDNILEVKDLGSLGWKNLENAFCGCENLTTFKGGDTSNVTNMSGLLWGSYNSTPDIGDWNVSKVTDMSHTFDGVTYADLDVSQWDVSSVKNMENMLASTASEQDLRSWDVSKVTSMKQMFLAAGANPDIRGWNTAKVKNMNQMFYLSSVNPNMSNWDFSSVEDMNQMLVGSQITVRNYTDFLVRVNQTRTVNNVILSATSQYYDSAAGERTALINTHGWTISDNGSAGPDPG